MAPGNLTILSEPAPTFVKQEGLPRLYAGATLERLPEGDLLTAASQFVQNFKSIAASGGGVWFTGPPGTWKSYTAAALLRELGARWQVSTRFWSVPDEATLLSFMPFEALGKEIAKLQATPVLLLDDFAQAESMRAKEALQAIVFKRFNDRRPTLFTSNLTQAKAKAELERRYGVGFVRRLWEFTEGYRVATTR